MANLIQHAKDQVSQLTAQAYAAAAAAGVLPLLASRLRNSLCYYIMNHIKKSTLIFVFLHFF